MASTSHLRLQVSCALLLCLVCGVAGAQTGPGQPMTTFLSSLADFPVNDPYCTTPPSRFLGPNPQSAELCTSIALPSTSVPAGVVDWILVELRETSGSSVELAGDDTVIARKPGLLLSSGRIVDAMNYGNLDSGARDSCLAESAGSPLEANDNCPDLLFEGITLSENLYVVVRHRNHLDIISSVAVVASESGRYVYDFSSNVSTVRRSIQKNFVGHLSRQRGVEFAMMAGGDVNQDGSVLQRTDSDIIRNHFGLPRAYTEYDINMDGFANQVDDLQDFILGNLGLFSPVPR